ncbi:uncharacterized protein DUF2542 [Pantoea sp. PNA 14-12]|uniref:DUF2542 family protein n=1 Tax=Pantoea TaxID=53335 RepID=UPI000E305717|nr:uncharacterized protein DUF2542 [Pantoea sp. PNA 14-12]
MSTVDWIVAAIALIGGTCFFAEALLFYRRGIFTRRFKGTTRREYVYRSEKPDVYWLYMFAHVSCGVLNIVICCWVLHRKNAFDGCFQVFSKFF